MDSDGVGQMNSQPMRELVHRRGDYGIDAPYILSGLVTVGAVLLIAAAISLWIFHMPGVATGCLVGAALTFASAASYFYTTRHGKFVVWAQLLSQAGLRGDERIIDLGCGRGAVLLMAAQLLPRGSATGVDIWRTFDQSGNNPEVTRRNAEREGVLDRIELLTADIRSIPLPDDSFDVIVSSLAIHNLSNPAARDEVIDEAVRLMRPGGTLFIADIRATSAYADRLRRRGMADVVMRYLGWRFCYGGPFFATKLVTARKPE
jgi:arsenite methyltransferase